MTTTNPSVNDETQSNQGPTDVATQGAADSSSTSTAAPTIDWKKRHDDARTYINELKAANKAQEEALKESSLAKLPSSEAELEALAQKDPKLVEAMSRLIAKSALEQKQELDKTLKDVRESTKQLKAAEGFKKVLEEHPDALEIKKSDTFRIWLDGQPADVQSVPFNPDASPDMISLLFERYKRDTNMATTEKSSKQATKQEQIANSQNVSSVNKPTIDSDGAVITYEEAKQKFKLANGKTDYNKIREMTKKGTVVYT